MACEVGLRRLQSPQVNFAMVARDFSRRVSISGNATLKIYSSSDLFPFISTFCATDTVVPKFLWRCSLNENRKFPRS